MSKDCDECEGEGFLEEMCGNCSGLGERWEGVSCRPCKGLGEFKWPCEAVGCEDGQVEEDDEAELEEAMAALSDVPNDPPT